ncbi:MAG: hypothetical protein ACJATK_002272 [Paracoccaceae bacterium]|jgi:hypothetical protein
MSRFDDKDSSDTQIKNMIKLIAIGLLLCLLSACGTGEFFIKRGVNGLQQDVADEFKSYADFDESQKKQIDLIAEQLDDWVRADRLPLLYTELEKMADDIQRNASISRDTWQSTLAFLEQPMNLAAQDELIREIAQLVYGMTDQQAEDTLEKLQKEYRETQKDEAKETLEKRNKTLARGIKIVFSDLAISRSKAQLKQAKEMLAQRQSHIKLEHQESAKNYATFAGLIQDRQRESFFEDFESAWAEAERGPKDWAPDQWQYNAKIIFDMLNYLLGDLDQEQRDTASAKIRRYAALFKRLSEA